MGSLKKGAKLTILSIQFLMKMSLSVQQYLVYQNQMQNK